MALLSLLVYHLPSEVHQFLIYDRQCVYGLNTGVKSHVALPPETQHVHVPGLFSFAVETKVVLVEVVVFVF